MANDDLEELRLRIQKLRSRWQHKPPSVEELSALSELIIGKATTRLQKLRRSGRSKAGAIDATLDAFRGITAAVSFCIPNLPDAIRKNLECCGGATSSTGDIATDAALKEARMRAPSLSARTVAAIEQGWGTVTTRAPNAADTVCSSVKLGHPSATATPEPTMKRRGRPSLFSPEQLSEAQEMKRAGKRNNEIAKILYGTRTPTQDQRRSVPTVLKHHFGSKK